MKAFVAAYQPWSKKIYQQFSPENRFILLESIRFDPSNWKNLFSGDQFSRVAAYLGNDVSKWNPLNISLLTSEVGINIQPAVDNFDSKWVEHALAAVQIQPDGPGFSQTALGVAKQLRDQLTPESWSYQLPFLSVRNESAKNVDRIFWGHIFAILDNLLADPTELYSSILRSDPSNTAIVLICTAILAQPITLKQKFERFQQIFLRLGLDSQISVLLYLSFRGADEVAALLAKWVLEHMSAGIETLNYHFENMPGNQKKTFFHQAENLMILRRLSGDEEGYQKGIHQLGDSFVAQGLGFRINGRYGLFSLPMESTVVESVLASGDCEIWKKFFVHSFLGGTGSISHLLEELFSISQNCTAEGVEKAEKLAHLSQNPEWFLYFEQIIAWTVKKVPDHFLQNYLILLSKTAFTDHGLQCRNPFLLKETGKDYLYWAWLKVLLHGPNGDLLGFMMETYGQVEDWAGVIEIAAWVQQEHKLSSSGLLLLASAYYHLDEFESTIDILTPFINLHTEEIAVNLMMGQSCAALGNLEEAIEYLGRAIEKDGSNPQAWIALADVQQRLGQNDLAISILKKGLASLPGESSLSYALSQIYNEVGKPDDAYEALQGCEKFLLADVDRFTYYTHLLWELEKLAELQKVIFDINPEYLLVEDVVFYRARILQMQGHPDAAVSELVAFIHHQEVVSEKIYDEYFSILSGELGMGSFAVNRSLLSQIHDIQVVVDKALDAYPERIEYEIYWCEAQILTGGYSTSQDRLIALTKNNSTVPDYLRSRLKFNSGLCAKFLGETDIALAVFESLSKTFPQDRELIKQLAEVHLLNGVLHQAGNFARKAVDLNPTDRETIDWYVGFMSGLKKDNQTQVIMHEMVAQYPDSLPIKICYLRWKLDQGDTTSIGETLSNIIKCESDFSEATRNELVQLALDSHSHGVVTELFDAGRDNLDLPVLMWIQYLTLLQSARQYRRAIDVIHYAQNLHPEYHVLSVLEFDCLVNSGNYQRGERVLLDLISKTEQLLNYESFSSTESELKASPFQKEDLEFLQSPEAIYLRLALAARYLEHPDDFRSYSEMALALDFNHPVSQFIFCRAVEMNGECEEKKKLGKLLAHWQSKYLPLHQSKNWYARYKDSLLAESILTGNDYPVQGENDLFLGSERLSPKLEYALRRRNGDWDIDIAAILLAEANEFAEIGNSPIENGVNSIFGLLFKDDLWYAREKALNHTLVTVFESVYQYYKDHTEEEYAQRVFCDIGIRLLMLQEFYAESGIVDYLPDNLIHLPDLAEILEILPAGSQEAPEWQEIVTLVSWYQHIQQDTTLLLSINEIMALDDAMHAYYVLAARLTNVYIDDDITKFLETTATVETQGQLAISLLDQGNSPKSWTLIKRALGRAPENAMIRFWYAKVAVQFGESEAVQEGLQSALALWPQESSWHRMLAGILKTTNRVEEASLHLEYLNQKELCTVPERIDLAQIYIQQHAFHKAARLIHQVGQSQEFTASKAALQCLMTIAQGDIDSARDSFQDITCNTDLNRDVYLEMSKLDLALGFHDVALEIAKRAYAYSPLHAETLILLARCLFANHYIADARKIIGQIGQDATECHQVKRLELLRELGDEHWYKKEVHSAHIRFPNDRDICFMEAEIKAEEGLLRDALELLAVILQHTDITPEMHYFAGWLHNQQGNLDKSVKHLSLALEIHPGHCDSLLLLAEVYSKRRETGEALKVYQKGIQQHQTDYRFYFESGKLLKEMKLYGDAEFMLRKAVELVPERTDIRNQLGAMMALHFVQTAE